MDKNSVIGAGNLYFNTIDYVVFAALLVLSSLIGIYYGFLAKNKQDNTAEYLLGNKQITLLPISISLIASHISGINLLGFPTEIYAYGTQFWVASLTALAVPLSILYIFYPIFYDLQLLSTFMYFEKRYNRTVRLVGSAISLYGIMVFLPVVIYVPALALNQVSGVNVHVITPIICIVCVFYTTIGGLRAVVWTDTVQFFLTVGAALSVILLGILNLDDFTSIWTAADRGNRLIFFDLNPSPLVRSSFWTVVFGLTTTWVSAYGAAQSCIQKLLSVPNHKTAIRSIWIYFGGLVFFNLVALVTGLVMYANLEDCDPHSAGIVSKLDQVLPYFVMQVGSKIPGLPGLFISGIFSAALSTMSAYLNTMSCMIYDDFLRIRLQNSSEKTISTILKLIVLGLGLIVMGLVLVIERLGSVFQMAISLSGVAAGTVLGLFTTGMLCRKINSTGVIWGAIASVIVVATITVGAQHASKNETLPMRTDGCIADSPTNSTLLSLIETARTIEMDEDAFWLFRVSFMYYSLIGCATVWIVSLPISLLTKSDEVVDEKLLAPFLRAKSNVIEVEESKNNILTNNFN